MSGHKRAFVTGATGFVGSHLAWKLLQDGQAVTALARGSRTTSARDRVVEILKRVADSQDYGDTIPDALTRLTVLEGDISCHDLGIAKDGIGGILASIDETWHCAASLSFAEEERDEIFRMNVDGVHHVADFVTRTSGKRLHHISTAYVAGVQKVALEDEVFKGQRFRNPYEESKCRAEELISEFHAAGRVSATIHRPSVVIGDSRTGRITHFHGVYAFIKGLWSTLERLRRRNPTNDTITLDLRVPGSADETLNFAPINYVVNGMVAIGRQESSVGKTYHLANPEPTPNRVWLPAISKLLGVEGLHFVDPEDFVKTPPNRLEALFRKHMAFYYMYLQGEPRFDCRNTIAALKDTGIACPVVTEPLINKMIGWYIDHLEDDAL